MKANNINSNGITSIELAILRELGVESGSHFRGVVKTLRQFLKIGYTHAEARLATSYCASYINRLVALAPKANRKQRHAQLVKLQREHAADLSAMYDRYFDAYTKRQAALKREENRRRLHASRLQTFKRSSNRREKHSAFGVIKVRIETFENTDLALHLSHITILRRIELDAKERRKHNEIIASFKEGGKHLTARVAVDDKDLADDEAPLKELTRRYIPGGLAREFSSHARLSLDLTPLEIIKTFPGNTYIKPSPQQEQPEALPAEIVVKVIDELPPAPEIVPVAVPLPQKRQGGSTTVETRPDQADFAAAVRHNCYDRCVITGATLRYRTEAAHLVEHKRGGADHFTNGLLMRIDLHRLFDAGLLAINPVTLIVNVAAWVLAEDADLAEYHGKPIADTRQPIDVANLSARWAMFQEYAA
ncbi:HNH endonuclease [Pectobacterium brasiliense]|uniref:HNH endonuclease signature motif containing protein n=1 Tax=Pectobacterium brasiliense TaxID=180957 RepID=UPI001968CFFE|nr:HNH endonuclease signature motif containing protein [Pectobacterium brasiliense]QSD34782.1 HNH endonuclease [Pectobacterium brasiliense]